MTACRGLLTPASALRLLPAGDQSCPCYCQRSGQAGQARGRGGTGGRQEGAGAGLLTLTQSQYCLLHPHSNCTVFYHLITADKPPPLPLKSIIFTCRAATLPPSLLLPLCQGKTVISACLPPAPQTPDCLLILCIPSTTPPQNFSTLTTSPSVIRPSSPLLPLPPLSLG